MGRVMSISRRSNYWWVAVACFGVAAACVIWAAWGLWKISHTPGLPPLPALYGVAFGILGTIIAGVVGAAMALQVHAETRMAAEIGALGDGAADGTSDRASVLAHWRYDPGEWNTDARAQYRKDLRHGLIAGGVGAGFSGGLLLLITIYIGLTSSDPATQFPQLLPRMLPLCVQIAAIFGVPMLVIGLITAVVRYRQGGGGGEQAPEVFITRSGVSLNGHVYSWSMPGVRLEGVSYETGTPDRLDFHLRSGARNVSAVYVGASVYKVRADSEFSVPVPPGREAEARRVVDELSPILRA
jgi:hypothetical protein